ncbi:mas-related G-protein coupled receptor member X2-like [Macrotis lagotis]|uniref:mas-related G-protein coupled receptor member X2-like n=1 Tax=Macrotis lagotis TaxID=92651 RepID=UPI003D681023
MVVCPKSKWEYVHENTTGRSKNHSFVPGVPGEFPLGDWMLILSLLIALVGLVGNSLILWLLGFRIPRNPFSVYILNLAGADALFLCCSFLTIINYFVRYFYSSLMCIIVLCLRYMLYIVGLSLLAVISTERFLSVLFPVWYRCHRPKHLSTALCTVLWALASLFEVVYFVALYQMYSPHFCSAFLITEFVWFLLLTCVLCVNSLTLLLRVHCTSWCRQPPRFYLLVLLNVLVFLLCGVPLGIMDFLWLYYRVSLPHWLPWLLACVNSSANPFIYFFLGRRKHKRGKETLRVVLQRALGDDQDL